MLWAIRSRFVGKEFLVEASSLIRFFVLADFLLSCRFFKQIGFMGIFMFMLGNKGFRELNLYLN